MKTVPEKFIAWIIDRKLRTSSGKFFEWHKHRFLLDPLSDMHPIQGWNKSAQIGGSETMILKALYLAVECGLNIGYTIHNAKAMKTFGDSKIDPIIEASEYLLNKISGNSAQKIIDFKGHKRFIHLVGAYNSSSSANQEASTAGIAFTADALIHDESSRSDPYVIDQLQSRILDSDYQFIWKFDNPKYPGFGADAVFQDSDQMHYMVTCNHCGKKQYLDWMRLDQHDYVKNSFHCYVDVDLKSLVCSRCLKVLDDEVRRTGDWVPKFQNKAGKYKDGTYWGKRGYWINQLMYIHHTIESLIEKEGSMSKSVFANMILGKPYIASDIKVTRESIVQNIRARDITGYGKYVCMGVDQGREKQYVLGDEHGIFKIGRTNSWDEIERILHTYNVHCCVIDASPESYAKHLSHKYRGKTINGVKQPIVFRAKYNTESDQLEVARFGAKSDNSLVLIRRHEKFDELADKWSNFEMPISINVNDLGEFIDEWTAQVRVTEEDAYGNHGFKWIKPNGRYDDFAHATLYWDVAMGRVPKHGLSEVQKFKKQGNDDILNTRVLTTKEVIRDFEKSIKIKTR